MPQLIKPHPNSPGHQLGMLGTYRLLYSLRHGSHLGLLWGLGGLEWKVLQERVRRGNAELTEPILPQEQGLLPH